MILKSFITALVVMNAFIPGLQAMDEPETMPFQTEVSRLLDIIINSLYSQKDIFMREAISNASDALDKLRFMALSDKSLLDIEPDMSIKIESLPEEGKIVITDTGIGMTRSDLVNNLGTIARSGTTQFLEAISKGGNLNLIGQFGVGFYSYFLIADRVTVISKHAEDKQYIWESSAGATFSIKEDTEGPFLTRGTRVILHVKNDMKEYNEIGKLKELVKRYSEFINFPIYIYTSKQVSREVEDDSPEAALATEPEVETPAEEKQGDEPEVQIKLDEDSNEPVLDQKSKKKMKTIKETVHDWEKINDTKAIWLRPPEEVEDEEYRKFFKALVKDQNAEAMSWLHFRVEGEVEFTALLYIPYSAAATMFDKEVNEDNSNMKLFVRRVLISENFKDLLPKYLGFVKGVVDSDDLPLNVSRETLQQMRVLKTIKKKLVKKVLDRLEKIAKEQLEEEKEEDSSNDELTEAEKEEREQRHQKKKEELREKFKNLWKNFGRSLKMGLVEDTANKNKIAEIAKFYSTFNNTETLTSLEDYVSRKKENQKDIYYLAGDKKSLVFSNPLVRGLVRQGYEVLTLEEPIDEYCLQSLAKYKDFSLVNIGKAGFELPTDDDEKAKMKKLEKYYQPLTEWASRILSESIDRVKISSTLTTDPMAVLANQHGYSAHFEKIARAQASTVSDERFSVFDMMKKNLEINPYHPFIKELLERVKATPDKDAEDTLRLMFDVALLNSGFQLKNQPDFASKFYRIVGDSLGVARELETADIDLSDIELDTPSKADEETSSEELNFDDQPSADEEANNESTNEETTSTFTAEAEATQVEDKIADEEL